MLRAAHGLESPPVGEESRQDLRAFEALNRLVGELEGWLALGGALTPDEIVAPPERAQGRPARAGEAGAGGAVSPPPPPPPPPHERSHASPPRGRAPPPPAGAPR